MTSYSHTHNFHIQFQLFHNLFTFFPSFLTLCWHFFLLMLKLTKCYNYTQFISGTDTCLTRGCMSKSQISELVLGVLGRKPWRLPASLPRFGDPDRLWSLNGRENFTRLTFVLKFYWIDFFFFFVCSCCICLEISIETLLLRLNVGLIYKWVFIFPVAHWHTVVWLTLQTDTFCFERKVEDMALQMEPRNLLDLTQSLVL